MKLTEEERALLDSVERGAWRTVRDCAKEKRRYEAAADATLRKDKRVNIRGICRVSRRRPPKKDCRTRRSYQACSINISMGACPGRIDDERVSSCCEKNLRLFDVVLDRLPGGPPAYGESATRIR